MKTKIRFPAAAGSFYPAYPAELRQMIETFLKAASPGPHPKALIVPHAGYIYSGPVAASGYARVCPEKISRVVLLGPSHRALLRGLAGSGASFWRTPLGDVPVECPKFIPVLNPVHEQEHSLEVQVPFLQVLLHKFTLIPLVAGDLSPEELSQTIEKLWGGPETLIVISSDLSHYQDYKTACETDRLAAEAILALDESALEADQACGQIPILGLLRTAQKKGLRAEPVDLRNSGDTAGPRDRVVGYGSFVFYESAGNPD